MYGGEGRREVVIGLVFGHTYKRPQPGEMFARETAEILLGKRACELTGAIRAIICKHDHVAVLHSYRRPAPGHNRRRTHEFITFSAGIRHVHRDKCVRRLEFSFA